jgi:23S rRNA (uracil1939-C5)-methyltransferase
MLVTIEKVVYPGRRLAVQDGRTIFTNEGLPGEQVEVEIVRDHKSYLETRTARIITESPDRVSPRCIHYAACSAYQTMTPELQARVKAEQLGEILSRIGDLDMAAPDFVLAPDPWHYRNKVRFQVAWSGGRASLAYHAAGSETDVIPLRECHLVAPSVQALLSAVLDVADRRGLHALEGVEAKESRATGELLLNLFWSGAPSTNDLDPILSEIFPRFPVAGIVSFRPERGRRVGVTEWGRDSIVEHVRGHDFEIGAASFFQVHIAMLERILAEIESLPGITGARRIADLYCGIGTFGIALAGGAEIVESVESDPANVAFLKKNIARNRLDNVRIHEGRSEEWTPWLLEKPVDVVICDPPRKGLDPAIVRSFLTFKPGRIIYLSCNPTTLARDLKALRPLYAVEKITAFDVFPQTPHIETLAILSCLC